MDVVKKSFVIHLDSLDILEDLNAEQTRELVLAWRDYNLGKEPKLNGLMNAVFKSFKNQFDRDFGKYKNTVERNRNNGKNGGRPKTKENPVGFSETQHNQSKPKKPDNDNDNVNEYVNDYVVVEEYILQQRQKLELVAMTNKIKNKEIIIEKVRDFMTYCKINEQKWKTLEDAFKHFTNWLPINLYKKRDLETRAHPTTPTIDKKLKRL